MSEAAPDRTVGRSYLPVPRQPWTGGEISGDDRVTVPRATRSPLRQTFRFFGEER
jgi:hypothetical protein